MPASSARLAYALQRVAARLARPEGDPAGQHLTAPTRASLSTALQGFADLAATYAIVDVAIASREALVAVDEVLLSAEAWPVTEGEERALVARVTSSLTTLRAALGMPDAAASTSLHA